MSIDPEADFDGSGPALDPNDGMWKAGFVAGSLSNLTVQFTVGSVTVEGFAPGTALVAEGSFVVFIDPDLTEIAFAPTGIATVVPEPASGALLSLGILLLAGVRRERSNPATPR